MNRANIPTVNSIFWILSATLLIWFLWVTFQPVLKWPKRLSCKEFKALRLRSSILLGLGFPFDGLGMIGEPVAPGNLFSTMLCLGLCPIGITAFYAIVLRHFMGGYPMAMANEKVREDYS